MKTIFSGILKISGLAIALIVATFFSAPLLAVDCVPANIELNSQAEVNAFQATYGGATPPCDTITQSLTIIDTDVTDLSPLSALTSIDTLDIESNANLENVDGLNNLENARFILMLDNSSLANVDGLSSLTSTGSSLNLLYNQSLVNIDGLSSLTSTGYNLQIIGSPNLNNIDALSSLTSVGATLGIIDLGVSDLDGLASLATVGQNLYISSNAALTNLDGLSNLTAVGANVQVQSNLALGNCNGLTRLLDGVDDGDPGPKTTGIRNPDVGGAVTMSGNLPGCNSLREVLGDSYIFQVNPGLNDAWFNADTDGQGFLIIVFPEIKQIFVAWFTFDTERPPESVAAILGDPGHRWLTAQGPYDEDTATMTLFVTEGGVFDSANPPVTLDPAGDGTLTIKFADCTDALVSYEITSLGISGEIPIQRIAGDNVTLCEAFDAE